MGTIARAIFSSAAVSIHEAARDNSASQIEIRTHEQRLAGLAEVEAGTYDIDVFSVNVFFSYADHIYD